MVSVIRRCIGLFVCLALTLALADSARAQDSTVGSQTPVTANQNMAAESRPATGHLNHEQLAKEMEEEPQCPCMAGSGMGMEEMGSRPQMRGMMGMRMPGMKAPGMQPTGMGMPGMGMMGMPMMHMIAHNPKLAGKMMQMRADMMRAIADVLTKYGKQMESDNWPAASTKGDDD
jgi:hypothetical protein